MSDDRTPIPGSERPPLDLPRVGAPDPEQPAQVSLYLKRTEPPAPASTRAALTERRAASLKPAMDRIAAFAGAHGLEVVERHPGRRLVKLSGSIAALEAAFGTRLHLYNHPRGRLRARSGALTAPSDVADMVEGGAGARPTAGRHPPSRCGYPTPHAADAGHLPNAVTRLYGFPATPGPRRRTDNRHHRARRRRRGGRHRRGVQGHAPGRPHRRQRAGGRRDRHARRGPGRRRRGRARRAGWPGAGAPGATLVVYFAPNTDQGFVDAISQAAHDEAHPPSVMSISWGGPESGWTGQAVAAMTSAFQDAANLGVSVFAASGDGLADRRSKRRARPRGFPPPPARWWSAAAARG